MLQREDTPSFLFYAFLPAKEGLRQGGGQDRFIRNIDRHSRGVIAMDPHRLEGPTAPKLDELARDRRPGQNFDLLAAKSAGPPGWDCLWELTIRRDNTGAVLKLDITSRKLSREQSFTLEWFFRRRFVPLLRPGFSGRNYNHFLGHLSALAETGTDE